MSSGKRSLYIGKPSIEKTAYGVRLCSLIRFPDVEKEVWISVEEQYGEYLLDDRSDAFVAGILTTAMSNNMDIVCEAPVTRRLLYQLNHYLIPMMAANMKKYHHITIYAEPEDAIPECAGAVATGWTRGVDSMFTLMKDLERKEAYRGGVKLTHLLITSNGSLEEEDNTEALKRLVKTTREGVAAELGLNVIGVDSNWQDVLAENFFAVVDFRHAAVVLALQRLFGRFLLSSTKAFSKVTFCEDEASSYELISLGCLSTACTTFYSSGGAFTRIQKLKELSTFPMAQRMLHPCINPLTDNCGKCKKCILAEVVLYGYGMLEQFSSVFDVEEFERNKDWYYAKILSNQNRPIMKDALALLTQRGIDLSRAYHMVNIMRAAGTIVSKDKRLQVLLEDKLTEEQRKILYRGKAKE